MWLCSYCESANPDKQSYCFVCGHWKDVKYNQTLYCTSCGAKYQVDEKTKFCINCGKQLIERKEHTK